MFARACANLSFTLFGEGSRAYECSCSENKTKQSIKQTKSQSPGMFTPVIYLLVVKTC